MAGDKHRLNVSQEPFIPVAVDSMSTSAPPGKRWVCFRSRGDLEGPAAVIPTYLKSAHAEALAELIPILMCGEESAALAFDQLGRRETSALCRAVLLRIARDEDRHQTMLASLRCGLPEVNPENLSIARLRRFFKAVGNRNVGKHFMCIAALDSAVCCVLSALRARHSPIAGEVTIDNVFRRIHCDEARHVTTSLRFSRALANAAETRSSASETRRNFSELLRPHADAFDRLEVDPRRLFARIEAVPDFLLR